MSETADPVRFLHVDDDAEFAETAAAFLEREDDRFTVTTATSAADGLDVLATEGVDCVVSDYEMPGRTGIEFLEAVRTDHPDLPFVLFAGKGSDEFVALVRRDAARVVGHLGFPPSSPSSSSTPCGSRRLPSGDRGRRRGRRDPSVPLRTVAAGSLRLDRVPA